ncbi:MAG: ABC transporter ATP-binding protein [SAR86 cluster bacterium]|uniref:ABC transporter ATP-binding protein n=1 Tax=SAR86 cluster bacterium TaxID=2030880 RepID=A0A2A5B4D0_9GAMM|nr:MAG: ABC transporter ATP-binding protein [SAR86 cluster bacterium]
MATIKLQGIAHSYNDKSAGIIKPADYAVNSLNQCWQDGGAYALLGPSGCGKTTLLNIISGLIKPTEGRILFDDVDVTDLIPEQRNIAQVFQFPVVYDTMTVAENLAFPLRNRGMAAAEIESRVKTVLSMLGLDSRADSRARSLNADDKQKISLGRGLVRTDVKAILFDEPLTVIDPHLKWQLRTELKKIHQQFKHTMIYVTHDQTEALTFADKVIVMHEGSIVQIGTPQQLFEQPGHTFVGKFIGSPGMNVLPCQIEGSEVLIGGIRINLQRTINNTGEKFEIGVRPEHIQLSAETGMSVEVVAIEDVGRHVILRARLEGIEINIIVSEGVAIPESPKVIFDIDKINLYANDYRVADNN